MIALLLVVALCLYLACIGQALLILLRPRLGLLRSWLLAPAVGLALLAAIATPLNILGWPVRSFGPALALGLLLGAALVFWRRRPVLPWRQLTPFLAVAAGMLLYTGWPLLRFGFNWVSYGNDDMVNYCLSAARFLDHGYYATPSRADLMGRDLTQVYWFLHAMGQIRPGAEMTLAWISSVTGVNPVRVFMPAILMLGCVQLWALGALVLFQGRHRRWALAACILLAASPLFSLALLQQVISQVGGIAFLLAGLAVLAQVRHCDARNVVLAGLLCCGMGLYYPEIAPFFALSILLFEARLAATDRETFRRHTRFAAWTAAATFALLGFSSIEFLNDLALQVSRQFGVGISAQTAQIVRETGVNLFPWTVVPSFIPTLFGLHAYGVAGADPRLSIEIGASLVLLGFTFWCIVRSLVRNEPVGYLAAIMALVGLMLFHHRVHYGLFKLAMFCQPALAAMISSFGPYRFGRDRRRARLAAGSFLLLFVAGTMPAFLRDVYRSCDLPGSRLGVAFHPPAGQPIQSIDTDLSNIVDAGLLAFYTRGTDTHFLSRDFMHGIAHFELCLFFTFDPPFNGNMHAVEHIVPRLPFLRLLLPKAFLERTAPLYEFPEIKEAGNRWSNTDPEPASAGDRGRLFVALRSDLDDFNKLNPDGAWARQGIYQYKPESQLHNRLVFINSMLGQHYYLADNWGNLAVYQSEPEYGRPEGSFFFGTGRTVLFQVIHPSPLLRVMVDFTSSPLGGAQTRLPDQAAIIGADRMPLPFVGSGSARIASPLVRPRDLEGRNYLTIDFGRDPQPLIHPKTGLMRLYGKSVNLDYRLVVGFTRDISILTEEQYLRLPRPEKIDRFPDDLFRYPGLEYSGLAEDGWIARDAYVTLGASRPGQTLRLRCLVPGLPKFEAEGLNLAVSINGKAAGTAHLKPGECSLAWPVASASATTLVTLHFSGEGVYDPNLDQRPVSALVREISIGGAL